MTPGINGPSGLAGTRDADTMLGELLACLKATGPGQDHRCLRHRRSRLPHHQPCQRHQPFGAFRSSAPLVICRPAFWRSTWRQRWACRCARPATLARSWISAMAPSCRAAPACWAAIPPSRRGGGGQWRLGPDLSARQTPRSAPRSWPATSSNFSPTQDYVSGIFVNDGLGKFPGALPMSDVGSDGRGAHAAAGDLCQFPHLLQRLRQRAAMRRGGQRYAAGHRPGQSWQLQPGRDPQFHGRHRARISKPAMPIRRPSPMPTSPRPWRI